MMHSYGCDSYMLHGKYSLVDVREEKEQSRQESRTL